MTFESIVDTQVRNSLQPVCLVAAPFCNENTKTRAKGNNDSTAGSETGNDGGNSSSSSSSSSSSILEEIRNDTKRKRTDK